MAAPLLLTKSLREVYELLNSERLLEVLKVDGVTNSTVASLCLSLEASIALLQDQADTLSFFYLIGLLPGGIFKDELQKIVPREKADAVDQQVQRLMDLSLLQVKEQAGDKAHEKKLILPPFINTYAEQTIHPTLKNDF